jgi:hypothetical protein
MNCARESDGVPIIAQESTRPSGTPEIVILFL